MADILVPDGLKEKARALMGSRRDRAIVAAIVVGAVMIASALWLRAAPATIAPPAQAPVPRNQTLPASQEGGGLFVHVAGAVRRPGLYEFPPDARVANAVRRARPRPGADLDALNLAEPLADGAKVDVPRKGEVATAPGVVAGAPAATSPATIDINTADLTMLETIPDVGPVTAQAIIDYRTENGPFEAVEELLEVSGIGPATIESMRPYVTV